MKFPDFSELWIKAFCSISSWCKESAGEMVAPPLYFFVIIKIVLALVTNDRDIQQEMGIFMEEREKPGSFRISRFTTIT